MSVRLTLGGAGPPPTKVTAEYDGTRPHTRVMGIEHVYLAPPTHVDPPACAPAPPDAHVLGAEFAHPRSKPPVTRLTLARLGKHGRARSTTSGAGPSRRVHGDAATVFVRNFTFGPRAADCSGRCTRPTCRS